MTSPAPSPPAQSHATTPLARDELAPALQIDVFDRDGKARPLGDLIRGKRTVLVFIRHFWCLNCQAYVRYMSEQIPPSKLPRGTQILVIGCGSPSPISTYATASSCLYPIYTDPSLRLHTIFSFQSNLSEGKHMQPRDYMRDAGSAISRVWGGVRAALGHLEHVGSVGPKALNGGEVVISADGECEYIYRMQNTVDHTNVEEIARMVGVEWTGDGKGEPVGQECGDACEVGAK